MGDNVKLQINIDMNNAAFEEYEDELAQLLMRVDRRIKDDYTEGRLRDTNGNIVGHWALT
jgi:hypothetical protein